MSAPLRLAFVGAGRIARAHAEGARSLAGTPDAFEFVGVADADPTAAATFATELGVAAYTDAGEVVSACRPDLVVLCTPPATHEAITIDVVGRGVSVLCEKPFAIGAAGADRVLRAADEAGVLCTMASKFRYVPDIARARALIAEGAVGEVVQVQVTFTSHVDMMGRWNADPAISGGGVIIDNATHSVDIVRYLLGPIVEVLAIEGRRIQPLPVEDTAKVLGRTANGALVDLEVSWSLDKSHTTFVWVHGTEGEIHVGWKSSMVRRDGSREWQPFGSGYDKVAAMGGQLADMARAIRGGPPPRITVEDALSSVEVVDAAYRSLASGLWERVGRPVRAVG